MQGSCPQLAGQFQTHSIMLEWGININKKKLHIYNKKVATNNFTKLNFKSYKKLRKKQCKKMKLCSYMNDLLLHHG